MWLVCRKKLVSGLTDDNHSESGKFEELHKLYSSTTSHQAAQLQLRQVLTGVMSRKVRPCINCVMMHLWIKIKAKIKESKRRQTPPLTKRAKLSVRPSKSVGISTSYTTSALTRRLQPLNTRSYCWEHTDEAYSLRGNGKTISEMEIKAIIKVRGSKYKEPRPAAPESKVEKDTIKSNQRAFQPLQWGERGSADMKTRCRAIKHTADRINHQRVQLGCN